jgi:uncharacterized membrane protein YeiH
MRSDVVLLVLDLAGTFAFALNGALTAMRTARIDLVGVLTLASITAIGGGILRDVILGAVPPATFSDWRYLAVAAAGGLLAFFLGRLLAPATPVIELLDAAGLSLFAVTGALKALEHGLGPGQAIILGAVTAVGGGTLRDVLLRRVPDVLHSGLYAVPALLGAAVLVLAHELDVRGGPVAVGAAALCFAIRLLALRYRLNAPSPPRPGHDNTPDVPGPA